MRPRKNERADLLSDAELFANRSALFTNGGEFRYAPLSSAAEGSARKPLCVDATPMAASLKLLPGSTVRWRGRRYLIVDYQSLDAIIARQPGKRRLERIPVNEAAPDHASPIVSGRTPDRSQTPFANSIATFAFISARSARIRRYLWNLESSRPPLARVGLQVKTVAETYSTVGRSLLLAWLSVGEKYRERGGQTTPGRHLGYAIGP